MNAEISIWQNIFSGAFQTRQKSSKISIFGLAKHPHTHCPLVCTVCVVKTLTFLCKLFSIEISIYRDDYWHLYWYFTGLSVFWDGHFEGVGPCRIFASLFCKIKLYLPKENPFSFTFTFHIKFFSLFCKIKLYLPKENPFTFYTLATVFQRRERKQYLANTATKFLHSSFSFTLSPSQWEMQSAARLIFDFRAGNAMG